METKRKSAKYKSKVVLELLRGESAEELSRKYGITMAELSSWRDEFIDNGNITQSIGLIKKYLLENFLSLTAAEYHILLSYNEQGIYNHFKDYISENFFDELTEKLMSEEPEP